MRKRLNTPPAPTRSQHPTRYTPSSLVKHNTSRFHHPKDTAEVSTEYSATFYLLLIQQAIPSWYISPINFDGRPRHTGPRAPDWHIHPSPAWGKINYEFPFEISEEPFQIAKWPLQSLDFWHQIFILRTSPRLPAWPSTGQCCTSFQLVHCYRLQTASFFCRSRILAGCGVSGRGDHSHSGCRLLHQFSISAAFGAIFSADIENFWSEYLYLLSWDSYIP